MIQEKSKITSKGQITLPVAIRRRLGLKEGDQVVFDVDDAGVVKLRPDRGESRFEKYRGSGAGDLKSMDEVHKWLRELRGRDEE
ncbi:AbrB/MazE/SpoVT family DNA-binding domain-containing protein [Meiothermus sp.]|uniref:AbrB/MazE/SpoVT family DNA-binding domain-containing protein n=1 Tax=Meiothermus sp. TaxID=1955249 RepID=UPI00307D9B5E